MSKVNVEGTEPPPPSEAQDNCCLEIWGDPAPRLSPNYGLAAPPQENTAETTIYEYFWTLRMFQPEVERNPDGGSDGTGWREALRRHVDSRRHDPQGIMQAVLPQEYTGYAHVRLLFPRNRGFWIHEIAASVKLLDPPPLDFAEKVGKDLTAVQPLLGLAGGAVAAVGAVGGPVVSAAGHVLSAVAKVKTNDVPSTEEFPWSVQKFSVRSAVDEWDGIVWNLPGDMFKFCGDRITGSLAVVFLPSSASDDAVTPTSEIHGHASFEQQQSVHLPEVDCSFPINPKPGPSAS